MNKKSTIQALIIPIALGFILMCRFYIGDDLRDNAELYLLVGTLITFCVFVMVKGNLWVGLFLLLALVSSHYPQPPANYSQREAIIFIKLAQQTFTFILIGVAFYVMCVQLLNNPKALRWSLNVICVFALMNVVFLILQYFDLDPLHHAKPGYGPASQLKGLMTYPHGGSAVLAMCAAAFRGKWAWCWLAIALGLVLTHTFAGPMAIVFAILVVVAVQAPWSLRISGSFAGLVVCLLILLSVYAYFVDIPDVGWRLKAWKIAVFDLIPLKPIFGYGLGHWQVEYANPEIIYKITGSYARQLFGNWYQYAHSCLLQAWMEMGIGVPILFVGYIVNIVRRFRREAVRPLFALSALFACSMVAFPFHIGYSAAIGLFIMAWLEVKLCSKPQRFLFSSWRLFPWRSSSGKICLPHMR